MDRIDRAISIFQNECIGAFYEQTLAEGAALWALSFAGKISEIRHRIPTYFAEGQKRNDIHRLVHVANLVLLPLADDDPQLAERELDRRLKLISEETVGLPHLLAYYGQMQIHLYRGDGAAALADDQRRFPAIAPTVNYFQTARLLRRYALGCAHIVCTTQQPQLSKHLRMAERCVREIERERAPLGNLFALLLRTGIASLEHKQAKSIASKRSLIIANLQRACEQFESLNMPIYAAAAKWRLGEFVENSRGADWMKSACDWMTSQRIISPQRMTALFIPGDFTG